MTPDSALNVHGSHATRVLRLPEVAIIRQRSAGITAVS